MFVQFLFLTFFVVGLEGSLQKQKNIVFCYKYQYSTPTEFVNPLYTIFSRIRQNPYFTKEKTTQIITFDNHLSSFVECLVRQITNSFLLGIKLLVYPPPEGLYRIQQAVCRNDQYDQVFHKSNLKYRAC